ncbi:SDR family oxidoreductase [Skermania piniformis]|uniref:SDR family oxidoreductase n=1 Tax=Skermania pinensis TaxID=39122 RepID=A0ABX8SDI9_9ACTN|nr:SDR family oxidoreductase [Skermania piniformis]
MTTFNDKKTLITGAAGGIGRATAIAVARHGAQLFLTDIDEAGLLETVGLVVAEGGTVSATRAFDIADYSAVTVFAQDIHEQFGAMNVVMNVAGVSAWGTVENMDHLLWQKMIDVNLMGPIHVIENFVPQMIEARAGGALVNVSSAAGLLALPWHAAYSASKYGLRGISEVLRFDLKRHKISVHLVVPGAVDTGLVESIEICGIDSEDPRIRRGRAIYRNRAKSPEHAATRIVKGVQRNEFLIYTSNDIRFGYWWARKFAWPYELVMQRANDRFSRFLPPIGHDD